MFTWAVVTLLEIEIIGTPRWLGAVCRARQARCEATMHGGGYTLDAIKPVGGWNVGTTEGRRDGATKRRSGFSIEITVK